MNNLLAEKAIPRVSVIIPIYNIERYLPRCLESIYQQTLRPSEFEVIIIDDNSTDNSFGLANDFSKKRENVKVIRNDRTLGPGLSRNIGLQEAKGEYLYFLDGDDYIDPITLEILLIYAYDNHADLVTSNFSRVNENGNLIFQKKERNHYSSIHFQMIKNLNTHKINPVVWNKLVKRSIFMDNNIFFIDTLHEDILIAFQMHYYAKNILYYPNDMSLYFWVKRESSIVSKISSEHIQGYILALVSRWNFILENESDGYIKKIEATFQEGFQRVIGFLIKRIISYEEDDINVRLSLYQSLYERIKENKIIQESIFATKDKSDISYRFMELFNDHISITLNRLNDFERGPNYKNENMAVISEPNLMKGNIRASIKNVSVFYKPLKFAKDVFTYSGNISGKIAYSINRIIEFLYKHRINLKKPKYNNARLVTVAPHIKFQVLFFCDVDYHIRHTVNVVRELTRRGITASIVDLSEYLNEGKRQLGFDEIQDYGDIPIVKYNDYTKSNIDYAELKVAIFFNDTGIHNEYIRILRSQGIATVGMDEGVNDFLKLSEGFTGKLSPYRTCEYVLLPGEYETQFFNDRPNQYFITGLPKIKEFYDEEVSKVRDPLAVINVNFSYGVLTYQREKYVKTAIAGCEKAGIDYIITQHPMDKGLLSDYKLSSDSVYDLLKRCSVYISRFSGTIIEALALGTPCVYHNPHNEKVLKFQNPLGAYSLSYSSTSLATAINQEIKKSSQFPVRNYAREFLMYHANIHDPIDPSVRIADVISNLVEARK